MPDDDDGQQQLIETEHPREKEFLKLARAIRRCDQERSKAQESRGKYAEKLVELFHECKLTQFVKADVVITLKEVEERVSVRQRPGVDPVDG